MQSIRKLLTLFVEVFIKHFFFFNRVSKRQRFKRVCAFVSDGYISERVKQGKDASETKT